MELENQNTLEKIKNYFSKKKMTLRLIPKTTPYAAFQTLNVGIKESIGRVIKCLTIRSEIKAGMDDSPGTQHHFNIC